MFRRLIRKMLNNKRMVSCLLIGLILAVAMISSIPIYTDGIMQRMLLKDLENYQKKTNNYPGTYYYDAKLYNLEKAEGQKQLQLLDKVITKDLYPEVGLPIITFNYRLTNDFLLALSPEEQDTKKNRTMKIEAIKGVEDHVKILFGRMPSEKMDGDAYEVMVTESAVNSKDMLLDKTYIINNILEEKSPSIKVKVVGVFTTKDSEDPFWRNGTWQMEESMIMNFSLFNSEYLKSGVASISEAQWYYALDYHKIQVKDLKNLVSTIESHTKYLRSGSDSVMPALSILKLYEERAKLLKTTLWVIQIPVLIMITYYIFMVSQLILQQEKNEIAVLKSRGASRRQIVKDYFMQAIILSLIALIMGPPLGLLLCNILGASNGFLQFVNRTRLPLSINLRAYLYSIIGVLFFIITITIPAISATKTTIVLHKQKNARKIASSIWKRYYMDVLLLAASLYGLYTYKTRQDILKITGVKGNEIPIDPLLFLISTLFIIAVGMIFLRIFPYLVTAIYKLGKKMWGPVAYTSLINASRSGGKDSFIILFLIITISIGLFSANAARTINTNVEEKIKYSVGADITLKAKWENDAEAPSTDPMANMGREISIPQKSVTYVEPPFLPYTQLQGVDTATKVFRKNDAIAQVGNKSYGGVYVMGIETCEFGKTAWFRNNLLPHHFNEYLNVLAKDPTAFLVSTSFRDKYKAKLGDTIYVKWGENDYLQGSIYAFVDYWPTFNPHEKAAGNAFQNLVIMNLTYVQAKTRMEPYEVWLKLNGDVSSSQLYQEIQDKKLEISEMKDIKQNIITAKNDPMLQGTNGALTMGFIVTMIICTIGFLIYWMLSIESRVLQFGIFRAMGMPLKNVLGILVSEQVLISGTAIIVGILTGGFSSNLFIPLLQIVYSSSEQVPPFKVTANGADYIKLYLIILIMLLLSFIVLSRLVSKIKINQAIKLGED